MRMTHFFQIFHVSLKPRKCEYFSRCRFLSNATLQIIADASEDDMSMVKINIFDQTYRSTIEGNASNVFDVDTLKQLLPVATLDK